MENTIVTIKKPFVCKDCGRESAIDFIPVQSKDYDNTESFMLMIRILVESKSVEHQNNQCGYCYPGIKPTE